MKAGILKWPNTVRAVTDFHVKSDVECFPMLAILINDVKNMRVQISPWDIDLISNQYTHVYLHMNP